MIAMPAKLGRKRTVRFSLLHSATLAIVVMLTASCGPQQEVIKIYDDSGNSPTAYKRLLVVDVTSDPDRQRLFEDEIVSRLEALQVDGIVGHTALKFSEGVRQEEITAYGDAVGADGILVTRIARIESDISVEKGRTEIQSSCRRGSFVDYFLYDHEVIHEPDLMTAEFDVVVVSSLYDVATRQRVWSIQSTCFDKSSLTDGLLDEARIIVDNLRDDGLI